MKHILNWWIRSPRSVPVTWFWIGSLASNAVWNISVGATGWLTVDVIGLAVLLLLAVPKDFERESPR